MIILILFLGLNLWALEDNFKKGKNIWLQVFAIAVLILAIGLRIFHNNG